jgi:hypothetical protein
MGLNIIFSSHTLLAKVEVSLITFHTAQLRMKERRLKNDNNYTETSGGGLWRNND